MRERAASQDGRATRPRRGSADRFDLNDVLAGGGDMGALMRSIDWSRTDVGSVSGWSQALRTTVGLLLRNRFPLLLWWGPKFVQFYNDAYVPIPGAKHPKALGQPASECWTEIWHVIGPMIEAPFSGQPATWSDDLFLLVDRKGFLEETHFKVAYSPVPDETVQPTGIGGVLATVAETTEQVYGVRQLRTLRELGARAAGAKTPRQACETAVATFQGNASDVPFALIYLIEPDGKRARLAASCGFDADNGAANPQIIDLEAPAEKISWPLSRIIETRDVEVLTGLRDRFGPLPRGCWSESPSRAVGLPLCSPDQARAFGVLVAGCSPHRALDDGYRTFFELAAAQVITAIRNALAYEEQRLRAEKLAEIDRAKTVFFSNVSHEFRTPLTLMLGPTEDLLGGKHGELTTPQRAELELMRRNELRLQRLVNALLEFSRIEAGRVRAFYEPIDLASFTSDLASSFRAAAERAGLEFVVDCAPLDEPIFVDRDMWEQIVLNLLSNAFKFTFEGEIVVSLRAAGNSVELLVNDTGVGVSVEEVPRLFERFHRVEGTRARTHEGSGIGLALVQELVRLHGGGIHVRSTLGAGTSFTVTIPKGSAHLQRDQIGAARDPPKTNLAKTLFAEEAMRWLPEPDPGGGTTVRPHEERQTEARDPTTLAGTTAQKPTGVARILVADDNADMREYLRRILSPRWEIETVSDGRAALDAARQRRPDLILTDVMMPTLDGFGLLRELRASSATQAIPVIMLSARAGEESRVDGLEAGADDYLVKPFSPRELVARITTHLKLAASQGVAGRVQASRRPTDPSAGIPDLTALRHSTAGRATAELTDRLPALRGDELDNERFRSMVTQQALAGIAEADLDGRFQFANDRYLEIVGRSWEELRLLRGQDITHPDDLPRYLEQFQRLLEKGAPFIIEKRYVKPDGSIVWVQNSVSRIDDAQGRPKAIARVTVDITQRKFAEQALKESEERYRNIFETAEVSIWDEDFSAVKSLVDRLKDEHGAGLRAFLEANPSSVQEAIELVRLRDVNPATLRMFGASCKEELLGSLSRIFLPETHVVFLEELIALAEGRRLFSAEAALRTLAGRRIDVLATISFPPSEETPERVLVTLVDFSARKLAELEREARIAAMERAVRFSEMFVGILGHDLRNPLSAISTSASLLSRRAGKSERIAKPVDRILISAGRMERMISQLLDFTRIRLGRGIPLERGPVDLAEILRLVIEEIESSSGREIELEVAGDASGSWDRDRLFQLGSNLAANACQYGTEGTPVGIRLDGSAHDVVRLEVRNQGPIPCVLLPVIFEPLRDTGDGPQKHTKSSGLGIGLYITQQIAFAHGGTIRVESNEPAGTKFIVELPRHPPGPDESDHVFKGDQK